MAKIKRIQGYLKRPDDLVLTPLEIKIVTYFAPLIALRKEGQSIAMFLEEYVFDSQNRFIDVYMAMETVALKGQRRILAERTIPGNRETRTVPRGTLLYVRRDNHMPERIDVEYDLPGHSEVIYSLDIFQWNSLKRWLKKVEDK